jgi:malonate-semialdehyde dehydrogenase (acetylating)/methylmalonate-semialdehyde dehydrogenase
LINGNLVESLTTTWREVVNPATQEVLARVPFATADEMAAAVASAQQAFKHGVKRQSGPGPAFFLNISSSLEKI